MHGVPLCLEAILTSLCWEGERSEMGWVSAFSRRLGYGLSERGAGFLHDKEGDYARAVR